MAREVGFVPQGEETAFPLRVREVVAMGRYPHLGPWRAEGDADREVIRESLVHVEAEALAARRFDTLSGGERQRVRIARALAQEGQALLLDEPSAGPRHPPRGGAVRALRRAGRGGRTVVIVTHNLGLAARLADRVLLFDRGRLAIAGAAAGCADLGDAVPCVRLAGRRGAASRPGRRNGLATGGRPDRSGGDPQGVPAE